MMNSSLDEVVSAPGRLVGEPLDEVDLGKTIAIRSPLEIGTCLQSHSVAPDWPKDDDCCTRRLGVEVFLCMSAGDPATKNDSKPVDVVVALEVLFRRTSPVSAVQRVSPLRRPVFPPIFRLAWPPAGVAG